MDREKQQQAIEQARRGIDTTYRLRKEREEAAEAQRVALGRVNQARGSAQALASGSPGAAASPYIAQAATALGSAGLAIAGVAAAAAVAGVAIYKLADAAGKAADRYAPYSGAILAAEARAGMRETLGDIRRASQYGPDLAKFVEARSKLGEGWEETKIKFLSVVVPSLVKIVDGLTTVLDNSGGAIESIEKVNEKLSPVGGIIGTISPALAAIIASLTKTEQNTRPKPAEEKYEASLADLLGVRAPGVQPVGPQGLPPGGLNIPIFGGGF